MSDDDNDNAVRRPVVLVVGPFSAGGGIGTVCRHMLTGELTHRRRVVPFDNAKTTPANRSLLTAVMVHLLLLLRLAAAIIRCRPALVHLHTCSYHTFYRAMPDILIARVLLRPVILHVHGGYFHEFVNALSGPRRWLVLGHLKLARRIIVLGGIWKERLGSIVPPERIRVVHNGVPIPKTHHRRRRKLLRVVCVGDLSVGKAPEDLIEAVARLAPTPQVRVELIGDGTPERRALLERLIGEKGLRKNIRLRGQLSWERTQARLRSADVHVLPSRGEGLPLALLEAMAWGLPSVVTSVGAIPEVVTDTVEAFVVQPGDVGALADRLTRLLSDSGLRAAMGRSARERIETAFPLHRFHAALDGVWRDVLGTRGTVPVSSAFAR